MKKRKPTLAEIAKIAGVSRMTASRAMNNQPGVSDTRRDDILRIADELGYVANPFAQKLSNGRSHVIGVIAQLHTPFNSELVMSIGSATRGAGYEMLVYSLPGDNTQPPNNVVEFLQQVVDGVIALLPYRSGYLDTLTHAAVPIVTIDAKPDNAPFPSVCADNAMGTRQAISHLVDLGHKRIGFITGNMGLSSARERLQAYRDMVAQFNLDNEADLIAEGDFSQSSGFDAAKRLLTLKKRPSAIFASNDISAFGAVSAIREAGLLIPEDISIVGFDDIPISHQMSPTLSTIHMPLHQMGRSAVNLMMALVSGIEAPSQQIILPTELVVRQSSAPPK